MEKLKLEKNFFFQRIGFFLKKQFIYKNIRTSFNVSRKPNNSFPDPRHLGFQFEIEPVRNISVVHGAAHLLECSYVLAHERHVQNVRVEWKRDGVVLNERSNSKLWVTWKKLFLKNFWNFEIMKKHAKSFRVCEIEKKIFLVKKNCSRISIKNSRSFRVPQIKKKKISTEKKKFISDFSVEF